MLMPTPPDATMPTAPRDNITADLCIIGAGPGGLALATAAAALGQTVVLIEKHKMGGTSLNYGSIQAAALHATAERAHVFRSAAPFGITPFEPALDRPALTSQIAGIVETASPNASAARLTGLGVTVIQAAACFIDPKTVAVGQQRITARRFVVATGSSPFVPPLPGLANVDYATTDTYADQRGSIDHIVIIGGGAASIECAQIHRRLGARVTVVARSVILGSFDPELAAVVTSRLAAEGVVLLDKTQVTAIEGTPGRLRIDITTKGNRSRLEASHLLIACGRTPSIDGIGLEAAKIATTPQGIKVNASLRTSNRRVFALGDVIGLPHSTHRAEYHASLLLKTLVFQTTTNVTPRLIPASIHTDPEFATVGLTEAQARATFSSIQVFRFPVRENARAIAIRAPVGHIKIIADGRGKILGAAIVSRSATELIGVWALAVAKSLTLDDMSTWISPYPALSDITRQAASQRTGSALCRAVTNRWVKLLSKLG
jgi:pyruvate/2-oxoglutarate dehydrogenase complex dihydrolipoamide dehydrogenase (E3) component